MTHPLDPLAPLKHPDGTSFTEEERYAFFQQAEQFIRGQYRDNRAHHFANSLTIPDQLDMLWHELNDTGAISKDGAWFKAVQAVKEQFSKNEDSYQKALADVAMLRQKNQGV